MSDQSKRKEYLREYHKKWYISVVKRRREEWFRDNGPCVDCGSWERLELDHDDPSTKISHVVFSWGDAKRLYELSKCRARCHKCHVKKSVRECFERGIYGMFKKKIVDGKAWCHGHKDYLPVEMFHKDKYAANGCYMCCKECRRKLPSRKSRKTLVPVA
jgi:hypothetical protein